MDGDLISRSKVIDVLKETGIIQDNDLGHLVVEEIERIPTAYDVEKVVEQLETHKDLDVCENNCYECKKKYPNDDCPTEKCAFDKAIEIVRKGGV